MPKFTTPSQYLKHQDLDAHDWLVTITHVEQELMEARDGTREKKWVLYVAEFEKGLVLNSTNGKTLCKILGSEEMTDWTGRTVTLYTKDDIEFGGELVSGIRVRPTLPVAA